jgi:hypothetical protein
VISGAIPAKFRGIPRNFAEFRRNCAEIISEVKKFRGIPCRRNSVDTLITVLYLWVLRQNVAYYMFLERIRKVGSCDRIHIRTIEHHSTTMYLHFKYVNIEMTVESVDPADVQMYIQFESQYETLVFSHAVYSFYISIIAIMTK